MARQESQYRFDVPGFGLSDYVAEAIDFLRQNEPPEGYFVGFSGGKDSITTLRLCQLAGVRHRAFYSCTRIDPPEVMRFIRKEYPQVQWLFPKQSFWSLIQKNGPPFPYARWCCDYLKKRVSKDIPLKRRVMGIRAEESYRRAKYPRIDKYNGGQTLYKPIFRWPEWAVWEFIEYEGLPYPALYDEGFGRLGCVCCPLIFSNSPSSQRRIMLYQQRWPGMWKAFRHAVFRWFDNLMKNGLRRNQKSKTAEEFWYTYLHGGKVYNEHMER